MIWALLALLGVPIWLIVGALTAVPAEHRVLAVGPFGPSLEEQP